MKLFRLVFREIAFRKLNFALGAAGLVVAVACLVGALGLLRGHDLRTEKLLAERRHEGETRMAALQKDTQKRLAQFEDDTRKAALNLGFNMMILPKGQKLTDLYEPDATPRFMPETYAARLAETRVATINHVLPGLVQRVKWPERNRSVIVMGVRGEVYIQSPNQKPLLQPVAAGKVVLGYDLHHDFGLKEGDDVTLMGRTFKAGTVLPQRGTMDDATLWLNLAETQDMLGRKGLINTILALECNCEADRLDKIRAEIAGILPDVDVVEFASQAVTRAEMRNLAAKEADEAIERIKTDSAGAVAAEKKSRDGLRNERESLAGILVPVVSISMLVGVGVLMAANARERRQEIGILRTLGVSTRQVLGLFLAKAAMMGLVGAVVGFGVGQLAPSLWHELGEGVRLGDLFDVRVLLAVLASAPLVAILAGWIPAFIASQQDPAVVLQEE